MASRRTVRSFDDIRNGLVDLRQPVLSLFSGGLDSTYLLYRLVQAGATDVHALSVDLGGDQAGDPHKERIAARLGVHFHGIDQQDEFADRYVRHAIAAHAVYLDTHPVSSSLSRPIIAHTAVRVAREVGATTVLHSANRSQNTLRRFNGALQLLGFPGCFGSPYDREPVDRQVKIKELRAIGLDELAERSVSGDVNLWCREFESGALDDPEDHEVPETYYAWTARPAVPPPAEVVEIGFSGGAPVSLDGEPLPLKDIVHRLNRRVGAHGLGRYSGLEHLAGGVKVLEVREMPAAWLLLRSHRHLETAVLDAEVMREKLHIEQLWVKEALEGRWFGPLREACQAFVSSCSGPVTGRVRWKLDGGRTETVSMTAENPLYARDREEWEQQSIRAEFAPHAGVRTELDY
ncbi:argininosuccinate synthase-related protein [Streptomyces sp. NPDC021224]|uniref:argininosuccinate synthase-related protein n=1 Tax=unclassified Streptomyces TaxID=2593676 RepID=UPI00378D63B3